MVTMVEIELDGRTHSIPLMVFKKARTRAEAASTRPMSPHYNGKSLNSNIRAALREAGVGRGLVGASTVGPGVADGELDFLG